MQMPRIYPQVFIRSKDKSAPSIILQKILVKLKKHAIFATAIPKAKVAQLVERQPSKLNVAGSNPVFRSRAL